MRMLGNILWFVFGGVILSLLWALIGFVCCCLIVTIPIGIQCFKFASLTLWPFGRDVVFSNDVGSFMLNAIWISLCGWWLATTSCVFGLLWCISIVGIPFGLQYFKFARIALLPFGAHIVPLH